MKHSRPLYVLILLLAVALAATAPAAGHEASAPHCGGGGNNHGDPQVPPPPDDWDCDFVKDNIDNCPPLGYDNLATRNPNQEDSDGNGTGDWCQADDDGDGKPDWTDGQVEYASTRDQDDNCRTIANFDQEDENENGVGDVCEFDDDHDDVLDSEDNCAGLANPDQSDLDGDRIGDACDNDDDGDYVRDNRDNCPRYPNPPIPPATTQADADGDGVGTACDDDDTPPPPPVEPVVTATATPVATPSAIDRQAPRMALSIKSTQLISEVEDGLIVRLRCSEACSLKADATVSKRVARRLKLRGTTLVGTGSARTEGATTTYAFVRFNSRVRARLFKQSRTELALKVTATDPAGNVRRDTERLVLVLHRRDL